MILAIAAPKAESYIRSIKNEAKRAYARAYLDFVCAHPATWQEQNGPDYECSYMAAQAVRMQFYAFVK